MSRNVRTAVIARGSVDRYFEGMQDLSRYLGALAAERKFGCIDGSVPTDAAAFFERLRLTIFHGEGFAFSLVDAVRRGGGSPVPDDDLMAVLDTFAGLFRRGLAATA